VPVAKASDLCILLVEVARCFHLRGAALFLEDHPITDDSVWRNMFAICDFATPTLSNTCFVSPQRPNQLPHIASSDALTDTDTPVSISPQDYRRQEARRGYRAQQSARCA